jgi:hypothetical protein
VTRPANRPEGRGAARGYSWAPFERGNQVALRHGAHGARVYEPLAAELVAALLEARPDLESYPEAVGAWGRAEARCALLSEWVAERGLVGPDGEPVPGLRWLVTFERQAAEFRATLGLDPAAEARLAKERADATRGVVDLERLRERGREARQVAVNARRGALEARGRQQRAAEESGQGGGGS